MFGIGSIDKDASRLKKALAKAGSQVSINAKKTVQSTAKKVYTRVKSELKSQFNANQSLINSSLNVRERHNIDKFSAILIMNQTPKTPLKYLKAMENKKGVTYKVGDQTKFVRSAFVIKKYNNHVFKRQSTSRKPIMLFGPSISEMYKRTKTKPIENMTRNELRKEVKKRMRTIELERRGTV